MLLSSSCRSRRRRSSGSNATGRSRCTAAPRNQPSPPSGLPQLLPHSRDLKSRSTEEEVERMLLEMTEEKQLLKTIGACKCARAHATAAVLHTPQQQPLLPMLLAYYGRCLYIQYTDTTNI